MKGMSRWVCGSMPPGMTKQSGGVERAVALQVLADLLDRFAFDENVGLVGAVRGDDRSAFDDERHVPTSSFWACEAAYGAP